MTPTSGHLLSIRLDTFSSLRQMATQPGSGRENDQAVLVRVERNLLLLWTGQMEVGMMRIWQFLGLAEGPALQMAGMEKRKTVGMKQLIAETEKTAHMVTVMHTGRMGMILVTGIKVNMAAVVPTESLVLEAVETTIIVYLASEILVLALQVQMPSE